VIETVPPVTATFDEPQVVPVGSQTVIVDGVPVRVTVTAVWLPAGPEDGLGAEAEIAQLAPEQGALKEMADELRPVPVFLIWNVIVPVPVAQMFRFRVSVPEDSVAVTMVTVPGPVTLTIVASAGTPVGKNPVPATVAGVHDPTGPHAGLSAAVTVGAFVTLNVTVPEMQPVASLRISNVTVEAVPFGVMLTKTNWPPFCSDVPVIVTVPPRALKIEG